MGIFERRDHIDDGLRLECGIAGHLEHDMLAVPARRRASLVRLSPDRHHSLTSCGVLFLRLSEQTNVLETASGREASWGRPLGALEKHLRPPVP
jgi:hypothetical protein